jgi:hypothetical protein
MQDHPLMWAAHILHRRVRKEPLDSLVLLVHLELLAGTESLDYKARKVSQHKQVKEGTLDLLDLTVSLEREEVQGFLG